MHQEMQLTIEEAIQRAASELHRGRLLEAKSLARQIAAHAPDEGEAYNILGLIAVRTDAFEHAVRCFETAIEKNAHEATYHNNKGVALREQGRIEDAIASFKKAVQLAPGNVSAHGNLAVMFERLHRFEDAEEHLASALEEEPKNTGLLLLLANSEAKSGKLKQSQQRLESILICESTDAKLRYQAWNRLGKVYEKMKEYTKAFDAYKNGNDSLIGMEQIAEDKRQHRTSNLNTINYLARYFSKENIHSWSAAPLDTTRRSPVFLIGFPRSGTTLLRQILDSHSQIKTLEEKPALQHTVDAILRRYSLEELDQITAQELTDLQNVYWKEVSCWTDAGPDEIVIDKMPLATIHLGFIYRLFPDAKVIVLLRDPRDACLSCFFQRFKLNAYMDQFLEMKSTVELYAAVMAALLHYKNNLPLNYIRVKYEDLVSDFDSESARIMEFLQLPWEQEIIRFHEKVRNQYIATVLPQLDTE